MSTQETVNVGVIGGGLMGREAAAAISRWPALLEHPVRPRLSAVCDVDQRALDFFDRIETVRTKVTDYTQLLADESIDVVYVAVRHDLHEQICVDTLAAGKDLFVEKPFGIDSAAATRIVSASQKHPRAFVRCSSEIPFYPGAQAAIRLIQNGFLGEVIEVSNTFSHSSDLDRTKPIAWKRIKKYCGEAGVMNDLGMHVVHVPLRLGWYPATVYAVLQNLVPERPGTDGKPAVSDTHDNATLLCTATDNGRPFPLHLAMKRIDPGQKNSWTLRATGMEGGVEFSTRYPKTLRKMTISSGDQVWGEVEMGSQSIFPTVTGSIFEAGFSDSILQMWAAFLAERVGVLGNRFGCVTPLEALASHRIWSAALESATNQAAVAPSYLAITPREVP